MPEVVVACTRENQPVIAGMLAGVARVVSAYSEDEGLARIQAPGVRLLVCTIRFDESRMLDFASLAHQRRAGLPWICCRVLASDLPEPSLQGAFTAARTLGAIEVVDLPALERSLGRTGAGARFRALVARCLQSGAATR